MGIWCKNRGMLLGWLLTETLLPYLSSLSAAFLWAHTASATRIFVHSCNSRCATQLLCMPRDQRYCGRSTATRLYFFGPFGLGVGITQTCRGAVELMAQSCEPHAAPTKRRNANIASQTRTAVGTLRVWIPRPTQQHRASPSVSDQSYCQPLSTNVVPAIYFSLPTSVTAYDHDVTFCITALCNTSSPLYRMYSSPTTATHNNCDGIASGRMAFVFWAKDLTLTLTLSPKVISL